VIAILLFLLLLFFFINPQEKPWRGIPDLKLLLVPLVFFLTRIWSVVLRSIIYYSDASFTLNSCKAGIQFIVIVDVRISFYFSAQKHKAVKVTLTHFDKDA